MYFINLNVKKNTFNHYLLQAGFNFKIKQFDDFITSLKNIIRRDVLNLFESNNFLSDLDYIFGKNIPSILLIKDDSKIKKINEKYFKKIIKSGVLDLYIEDKEINDSLELHKLAYLNKYLDSLENYDKKNNIIYHFINEYYPNYFKLSVSDSKSRYLIENKGINLSKNIKESIQTEVAENLKDFAIANLLYNDYLIDYNVFNYENSFSELKFHFINIIEKNEEHELFLLFLKELLFSKDFIFNGSFDYPELIISFDNITNHNEIDYYSYLRCIHNHTNYNINKSSTILNKLIKNKGSLEVGFSEEEIVMISSLYDNKHLDETLFLDEILLIDLSKYKYTILFNDSEYNFTLDTVNNYIENKLAS